MKSLLFALPALIALTAPPALAHTPLCTCYDNGDGTVFCEGGFSDGSSARGVAMRVVGPDGTTLITGEMNENSEFEFEKPGGTFTVIFDAGPGHSVEVPADAIAP